MSRGPIVKELNVEIPFKVGKPLGLTIVTEAAKLVVNKVGQGSPTHGRIFIGDVITSVDGKKLDDFKDFAGRVKKITEDSILVISVRRRTRLLRYVGTDNEMLLDRATGCDYFLIQLNCSEDPTRTLGLTLSNFKRMMIVTDIEVGSFAYGQFRVLDRLIAINGTPINTTEEFTELIDKSGGILAILLERPISEQKKNIHMKACDPEEASSVTDITMWSVADPKSDIRRIGEEEQARMKGKPENMVARPILKGEKKDDAFVSEYGQRKVLLVRKGHVEVPIASDTDPNKKLKKLHKN